MKGRELRKEAAWTEAPPKFSYTAGTFPYFTHKVKSHTHTYTHNTAVSRKMLVVYFKQCKDALFFDSFASNVIKIKTYYDDDDMNSSQQQLLGTCVTLLSKMTSILKIDSMYSLCLM